MTAEVLDQVFDPYFTTKATGHGLGMAAVLGIIRNHGGGLWGSSKPGEGTTFKMLFPVLTETSPQK
jgi:signal transduction histidine kinase